MTPSLRQRVIAVVVLALATACDDDQSGTCVLGNDQLSVVATVVDNGAKVRAEVDFEEGDRTSTPRPVRVCDGETLTIGGKAPTVTVKSDRVVYSATLPANTPRTVEFAFARADADPLMLSVAIPLPFEITAPQPGQAIPRSEPLELTWAPAAGGAPMRISVEEDIGYGLCAVTETGDHDYKARGGVAVPDDGAWTIPAGAISSETPMPCRAFYNLRRVERSAYPETLSPGGALEGRVQRTVEIRSVP